MRKGPRKRSRVPRKLLTVLVSMLILVPTFLLLISYTTDLYRISLDDRTKAYHDFYERENGLSYPRDWVNFSNWTGYITDETGFVKEIEVTLSWSEDSTPMDLRSGQFYVKSSSREMFLKFDDRGSSTFDIDVLKDPGGSFGQNLSGPGMALRLHFRGLTLLPGGGFHLSYSMNKMSYRDVDMYLPVAFASWVPDAKCPYIIPVRTRNSSFPEIDDVWLISNDTMIKDTTMVVSRNIFVLPGGKLEVAHANLIMNSTQGHLLNLTVLDGGALRVTEATLTSMNITAPGEDTEGALKGIDYGYRYALFLQGDILIYDSTIEYFRAIRVMTDTVVFHSVHFKVPLKMIPGTYTSSGTSDRFIVISVGTSFEDCIIDNDLSIANSNVTMKGVKFEYSGLGASYSNVIIERAEFSNPPYVQGQGGIGAGDSSLEILDSKFNSTAIYSGGQPGGSLTVRNSTFDNVNVVSFNGKDLWFENNTVWGSRLGLTIDGTDSSPAEARIISNFFNYSWEPFISAINTELILKNNTFNPATPTYFESSEKVIYIFDHVPTFIQVYSEGFVFPEPTVTLSSVPTGNTEKKTGDFGYIISGPRCRVIQDANRSKMNRWCSPGNYYPSIIQMEYDKHIIDTNPFEVKLTAGPWTAMAIFKILPSGANYMRVICIHLTNGTFFPLLVFFIVFLSGLGIMMALRYYPIKTKLDGSRGHKGRT